MERITEKHLEALVNRLNRTTGNPETPWRDTPDGLRANIGNYHTEHAYSGVGLVRMCNESGGISCVLPLGTKRELYDQLRAFLKGIESTKENA